MTTTRSRLSLFATGFIQVALVSGQTCMIARAQFLGVLIVGFLISLVWSVNVKRVAFGGWTDRILYASGAGVGAVAGMWIALHV
jgi:hypothetical protein